jgi:AcrR family transcriptional regulator
MKPGLRPAQLRIHEAALRLFAEKGTDQLAVSDLADAAGVARGTIYNNLGSVTSLFDQVAGRLCAEMHQRIALTFVSIEDPAERFSIGIRCFVRRAHEEPAWGRFLCRFGMSAPSLQELWTGPPMQDVLLGMSKGRYDLRPAQVPTAIALFGGSVLSAIHLVLEGQATWRQAGSDVAELSLRALGIRPGEARRLAAGKLPLLARPEARS